MRHAIAAALSLAVVAACSSSQEGEACTIVGTYSVVGVTESGDCPDSANEATTYTITASGSDFIVEIQGIGGGCVATSAGACKVQGKCDMSVKDAKDPLNARGTLQYSWTFDGGGFKGPMTISVPDAVSLPGGCNGTSSMTGSRR